MKNSKFLALALVGCTVFSGAAAFAEPDPMHGKAHEKKEEMMDEFLDEVDATDAQKQQLKAIHQKYDGQVMPLQQSMMQKKKDLMTYIFSPGATQTEAARRQTEIEQTKDQLDALMLQAAFEKKAVLTPEQQQKALQHLNEKAEEHMKHHK